MFSNIKAFFTPARLFLLVLLLAMGLIIYGLLRREKTPDPVPAPETAAPRLNSRPTKEELDDLRKRDSLLNERPNL